MRINTSIKNNLKTFSHNWYHKFIVSLTVSVWLTMAISRVLFPISRSTWWSSRLSCSLDTVPPEDHLTPAVGWDASAHASLCRSMELLAAWVHILILLNLRLLLVLSHKLRRHFKHTSIPRVCWLICWLTCWSSILSCSRSGADMGRLAKNWEKMKSYNQRKKQNKLCILIKR